MKYQVPQFIGVEDKIFGPLTLKQFLYVAGGTAIGFVIWRLIPVKFIAFLIGLPIVLFFYSLAFYNHNGRAFIFTVESAIKYFFNDKLYIWKKEQKKIKKQEVKKSEDIKLDIPKLSDSKLKEMSWSLDINENLANVENKDINFKV